jgi:hypothetical protein
MISNIDKYVDFLTENSINEHQFLIMWLVHTKDKDNIAKYKRKFGQFNTQDVELLIDKRWLDDFGLVKDNMRTYNIYDFMVTDKFTKVVVIDEEDSYDEFSSVYPNWLQIKGVKYPSKTGDPTKIAKEYFKSHKGNRLVHQEIVSTVKTWFATKEFAQEKIENFVLNKRWELLKEELNKGVGQDAFRTL